MAMRNDRETEAMTLRIYRDWKRVFVEVAAQESLRTGESRSAQDVVRDWLGQHPAVKAHVEKADSQ